MPIQSPDYTQKYSVAFLQAEQRAKKLYNQYSFYFKNSSYDVIDLIQDFFMVLINTLNKFSESKLLDTFSDEHVNKLCNKALSWHIKRRIRIIKRGTQVEHVPFSTGETTTDVFDIDSPLSGDSALEFNDNLLFEDLLKTKDMYKINFEELKTVLTQKEYYLIEEHFRKKKTLEYIAKRLGCTKQWVSILLKKTLDKVKQYID